VLSQQLSGATVVLRWSAYIHPRLVWSQVCGSCKMIDGWSSRVVSGSSIGRSGSAVSRWMAGGVKKSKAVSVAGGCLSIHDVCTLYAGGLSAQHLFGVSMVSIGRHPSWGTRPPLSQTGPSIAPENWYVCGTLAGLQLQRVSIRDGHIGEEQTHIPPGPYGLALRISMISGC